MNPHLQSAIDALNRKDLITATVEVNRAVSEEPENPEAYILRGQISLAIGDKRGAADDMKRALELRPDLLSRFNGEFTNK
jgi:Tfp pilus assembly protein PilF